MRRKWISLTRVFRYGLNNFSRNTWLTTAATAVMTITLLIIAGTFIARMVFNDTITSVRQKIDVSIYLKDDITPEQRDNFIKEIKAVPIVTNVSYLTKEEARNSFQKQDKSNLSQQEAFGVLDINPIPATIRVKTEDPNRLDQLNKVILSEKNSAFQIKAPSNSGERKAVIENIARASQFAETAGLVACTIFVVISIMIIFNTIRMAIFNRKDEIEMMKLIGADKRFIRGPFIIEACMYGILAAAFSILFIYTLLLTREAEILHLQVEPQIQVANTVQFLKQWAFPIVLVQMVVGVVIGILSSLLAMRRYLKV